MSTIAFPKFACAGAIPQKRMTPSFSGHQKMDSVQFGSLEKLRKMKTEQEAYDISGPAYEENKEAIVTVLTKTFVDNQFGTLRGRDILAAVIEYVDGDPYSQLMGFLNQTPGNIHDQLIEALDELEDQKLVHRRAWGSLLSVNDLGKYVVDRAPIVL